MCHFLHWTYLYISGVRTGFKFWGQIGSIGVLWELSSSQHRSGTLRGERIFSSWTCQLLCPQALPLRPRGSFVSAWHGKCPKSGTLRSTEGDCCILQAWVLDKLIADEGSWQYWTMAACAGNVVKVNQMGYPSLFPFTLRGPAAASLSWWMAALPRHLRVPSSPSLSSFTPCCHSICSQDDPLQRQLWQKSWWRHLQTLGVLTGFLAVQGLPLSQFFLVCGMNCLDFFYKPSKRRRKLISSEVHWCTWHRAARQAWHPCLLLHSSSSCLSVALCFPAGGQ